MFIENRPVIHLVDESTHFTAAAFLTNQSSLEIWKAISRLWINTYIGPPDYLKVDQGSNYISNEMKANLSAAGITLEEAPIETPGSIGIVERYHAPLRKAYTKIRQDLLKKDCSDQDCLKMAVYACNATMGPEGLCPMLLVFGALPRPARTTPSPTQLQRQTSIEEAKELVLQEQSKRRIAFALRHPGIPKDIETTNDLKDLPAGSLVLVYRTVTKKWEGPFKFISIDGETVVVQLPRGRKIFRSVCVKPYIKSKLKLPMEDLSNELDETGTKEAMLDDDIKNEINKDSPDNERKTTQTSCTHECKRDNNNECKNDKDTYAAEVDDDMDDEVNSSEVEGNDHGSTKDESKHNIIDVKDRKTSMTKQMKEVEFAASRKTELQGLIVDGTFEVVHKSLVGNSRIFGSRFIDELKYVGDTEKKKSRLVAQNYADVEAASIATKAPTVQRFSQRVALSIAASLPNMKVYTRDVTQAYIQSRSRLEREVYIRAPKEMELKDGYVLRVIKPLYGIPESGLHWYLTYLAHHLDSLGMKRTRVDPCVLIKGGNNSIDGLIILQVDDSLGFGSDEFLDNEEINSKDIRCKPRTFIGLKDTSFNGINICRTIEGQYKINQTDKIDRLESSTTQKGFASMRALAQYVGVNVRPDVCAPIQLIAPGSEPTTKEQFTSLRKAVEFLKETKEIGLTYVKLNMEEIKIVVLTDASFANAEGLKSQLGYLILLVDDTGRCNVLHYGSNRCRRIARSVMAAEIQALILGFDYAYLIKDQLDEILGRDVKIEAVVDSKTTFNVVAKEGKTTERRLQIDIMTLRQSYDNGELSRINWVPGPMNPSDPLTMPTLNKSNALYKIMVENRLELDIDGWATSKPSSHENTVAGVSM